MKRKRTAGAFMLVKFTSSSVANVTAVEAFVEAYSYRSHCFTECEFVVRLPQMYSNQRHVKSHCSARVSIKGQIRRVIEAIQSAVEVSNFPLYFLLSRCSYLLSVPMRWMWMVKTCKSPIRNQKSASRCLCHPM